MAEIPLNTPFNGGTEGDLYLSGLVFSLMASKLGRKLWSWG
jgi:hypothetical protein